jgi:hypothetical protein
MSSFARSARILAPILLITTALHLVRLGDAPVYFGGDEANFANHAYSLVTTGRDLNGRSFPVFFNINDPLVPNSGSHF